MLNASVMPRPMAKPRLHTKFTAVRLPPKIAREVARVLKADERTFSDYVRVLIRADLNARGRTPNTPAPASTEQPRPAEQLQSQATEPAEVAS